MNPKNPDADVAEIAEKIHALIVQAFEEDEKGRFVIVDQVDPDTLILELAIVELVPNKVVMNAGGIIAGMVVSGGGLIRSFTKGSIAFEARVCEGGEHKVVATFADREATQMALINMENATYYGFAEGILEEWASQLVAIANLGDEEMVEDSKPYKLNPLSRE